MVIHIFTACPNIFHEKSYEITSFNRAVSHLQDKVGRRGVMSGEHIAYVVLLAVDKATKRHILLHPGLGATNAILG